MKPGKTTAVLIIRAVLMSQVLFWCAQGVQAQSAFPPLAGDSPLAALPDSADIRARLWTSVIAARPATSLATRPKTETNPWGSWRVSIDRGTDAFYISIIPARQIAQTVQTASMGTPGNPAASTTGNPAASATGNPAASTTGNPAASTPGNPGASAPGNPGASAPVSYPQYAQGTWIIKRSSATGEFLQAKIFLRSDPGTFARIYPFGERSRMDIVAYGGVLYREVILPLPFEDSLRSPLSRIMRLSSDVVDWSLFSPDPALHAETKILAASIRRWLPGLRYGDDGALDADGRPVYIASLLPQGPIPGLNCSGFVKWIADGILHPLTGSWLSVAAIKERMTDWRGTSFTEKFEETHDPFFGLDWSRALAKEAWQVMYPGRNEESPLAHDVSDPPFALIVNDTNPVNGGSSYRSFTDNFDDAGIELAGLKATLFMLASREPGRFYLAQFNARDPDPPRLRRYFHIAALFPYFDTDGIFKVAVFESAEETSLDRIMRSTAYEYVKLVRMPSTARFEPPVLGDPAGSPATSTQATTVKP